MTLEELQTQRDALVTAMMRGVFSVQSGEEKVVYQTIEQMQKALDVVNAEIASVGGTGTGRTSYLFYNGG